MKEIDPIRNSRAVQESDENDKYIRREIEILEQLKSAFTKCPYFVRFHEAFIKTKIYLVFDYCNGGDLSKKIDKYKKQQQQQQQQRANENYVESNKDELIMKEKKRKEKLRWTYQISFGLKSLHEKNLTHRDIKPSLVFIFFFFFVNIHTFSYIYISFAFYFIKLTIYIYIETYCCIMEQLRLAISEWPEI